MRFIPSKSLFFLHIPKCAGKSAHAALAAEHASFTAFAQDLGVSEEEARRLALAEIAISGLDLPGFGKTHPAHLPLFALEQGCPRTFQTLREARHSFALTREPRGRFISALMQRMKEFNDAGSIRADDPEVQAEAKRVCDWLDGRTRFADLEFVHFIPQTDFVELDGQRIVSQIFPVDRTDAVASWLTQEVGIQTEIPQTHQRRQPKRWARTVQPIARFAGRRLMPHAVKRAIYPLWIGSGLFSNASADYLRIDLGSEVEAFVDSYYAKDASLHAEALDNARRVTPSAQEPA